DPVSESAVSQEHAATIVWTQMVSVRLFAVVVALLSPVFAQHYVERDFNANCPQAEDAARAYLRTRGFTEPECANCPNSLKAPKTLLDAHGKSVGTQRMRRDLAGIKAPFWLWSSPLHARVFISTKSQESGCRLGLWMDFSSNHTMVLLIFPAGERLGLPSNGKLEREYLDAMQPQPPTHH